MLRKGAFFENAKYLRKYKLFTLFQGVIIMDKRVCKAEQITLIMECQKQKNLLQVLVKSCRADVHICDNILTRCKSQAQRRNFIMTGKDSYVSI